MEPYDATLLVEYKKGEEINSQRSWSKMKKVQKNSSFPMNFA
jgi:hypothetical protein